DDIALIGMTREVIVQGNGKAREIGWHDLWQGTRKTACILAASRLVHLLPLRYGWPSVGSSRPSSSRFRSSVTSLFPGEHCMLFKRIKPIDQIIATAEKKSLTRQLGAFQLTMLGIGAIIGTGIFVLTAEAGQKAGPGMMIAFVIAAVVCAFAALAYAELAAMVPVAGSAYTYTYGVLGEGVAWIVGWA